MMMCVLRVFTPSSRPLNTRLLTQVPVVEPFLQVLHDVLPVWRKPHIVRVAMHLQVLDDLPTLGFRELRPDRLDEMTQMIPLGEVEAWARQILEGRVRGRVVVDVNA